MWQPWVGQHFHMTPEQMVELSLTQFVAMKDAAKEMSDS